MTELERIAYAKAFIDKMAMGQNPIDDTVIPDGDTLNQVRISRCLFYVSGVLDQLIKCGGIPEQTPESSSTKQEKKQSFTLTTEEISQFEFSDKAILAGEFVNRLNAIKSAGVSPIPKTKFNGWVLSLGLVEPFQDEGGRHGYRPTAFGAEIGLSSEMRRIYQRSIQAVTYNRDAQVFLMDNINGLLEFAKPAENKGKSWSDEDHQKMVELFQSGESIPQIARLLSRTNGGVRRRLRSFGFLD